MVSMECFLTCYKCGKTVKADEVTTANGWHVPYFIEKRGCREQTQLCPICRPRISLFMWLRNNKYPRWIHCLYASFFGYFCGSEGAAGAMHGALWDFSMALRQKLKHELGGMTPPEADAWERMNTLFWEILGEYKIDLNN